MNIILWGFMQSLSRYYHVIITRYYFIVLKHLLKHILVQVKIERKNTDKNTNIR